MAVLKEHIDHYKNHPHNQVLTSTSITMSNKTKDLMKKFSAAENNHLRHSERPLPPIDEMELSLSLSMNGRFGVDPNAKRIKRTLSIPEFMNPVSNEETRFAIPLINENLIRTSSLPAESEEKRWRRKVLQSQRRMAAKRKREEKKRNSRAVRERNFGEGGSGSEGGGGSSNDLVEGGVGGVALRRTPSLVARVAGHSLNGEKEDQLVPTSPPQGGSSGTSESEGQQQGQGPRVAAATNSGPQNRTLGPCVFTKGVGGDGRRINGFLYNYEKGLESRILCVCHGMFLTPAEFVKHAGGEDVDNPLKHIIVTKI